MQTEEPKHTKEQYLNALCALVNKELGLELHYEEVERLFERHWGKLSLLAHGWHKRGYPHKTPEQMYNGGYPFGDC